MSNSTITRCVLVTLLAFHFGSVCGTAQDASPVRDEAKPVETTQPPAATTAVDPLAASQMPDISGTWGVKIVEPKEMSSILGEMEIRRVQNGATDFLIDQPWVVRPRRVSVRWSDARQRFEGEWKEDESGKQSKITLLPLADKMKLRVIISSRIPTAKNSVDSDGSKENETKQLVTQEWTRTSSSLSTTFDKNNAAYRQLTAAVSTDDSDETMTHADAPAKAVQTKVFTLANCSAVECGKLLKVFFDDRGVTWDTRTNSIVVVSADEERMKAIEAILLRLDEAPSTPAVPKTDAAISFTSAAAPSSSGIPNTPAAKQLVEQLGAQESAAAAEAATIRQLQASGQAEQNQPPIAEHQRNLKNLLSTAFDLKLQWEELQVKELQSRLSRLERQIGQRKELREKIITRRAGELIEGEAMKWDSTGALAQKPVETAAKSKPNGQRFNPTAAPEMTTQIHFTGPKGMEVLIAGEPAELIAPVRHSFVRHATETQRYDIGFMKAPGFPDFQFVALLDIYPSTPGTHGFAAPLPATDEFLRHNTVPITITEADTRRASSELLIKVVYLSKPSSVETAIPEIKTLDSTIINPGGDVIAAANQFGTILAVLRLAKNVDQLGKLDPKSTNAALTRPRRPTLRDATHQVTIDFPMANFPVIPGDRIEVQHVLHAEEGFHGAAKIIASGLEVVGVARSLSTPTRTPTRTALTLATTPEMAAMLEQSATTGLLFCHPLDPVAMLPCGRAVRIPLGIRQEGRLAIGDLVQVDRMSLAIGKYNLAEPKFVGFTTGLLIGFEHGDIPEGTTEPKTIVKLLLPKNRLDAHVFQNHVDELIKNGSLFRGKRSERGDATQFHVAVTEIEWQIESLEKRIAYYQEHVLDAAASDKAQLNLGYPRIRLEQLKAQRELYKTSADVMARVRPLDSAVNDEPSPPWARSPE